MAHYTITLADLVRTGYQIFDNTWTTFVPEHKQELCDKIIRRYWFYEIGAETADRFKWNINEELARIMPYYNRLYETELMQLSPLYDYVMEQSDDIDIKKDRNRGVGTTTTTDRLRKMAESIKKLADSTSNKVGNTNFTGDQTWSDHETYQEKQVTDQDTTEKTTQNVTFNETVDQTTKEVMQDIADGTKTTDGTQHVTSSSEKRYSDTPQGQISSSGIQIENAYLTNYTRESGSSDTTTHTDEKAHNQEDRTTDGTLDKTTNSTQDTTKDVTGTNDVTVTTNSTKDRNGDKHDKDVTDDTEDVTSKSVEHDFSNGSQSENDTSTSYLDETEKEGEKQTHAKATRGFTRPQAELIRIYRESIINVDSLIIESLIHNFMGVF